MVDTDSSRDTGSRDLPPEPRPPALQPLELARWAWRQLTSMRTALVLLFLLALAAVPGSLVPQRSVDPRAPRSSPTQHPTLGAVVRPAVALRGLLLAVVRRDLPAAVRLARRLRAAAQPAHLRARARPAAARAAHLAAAGARVRDGRRRRRRRAGSARRAACAAGGSGSTSPTGRRRPSGATCARPATCVFHLALLLLLVAVALGSLVRLQGQRAGRRGRRLRQHPDRLRHLDPRAARSATASWGRSPSRSTTWPCATSRTGPARRPARLPGPRRATRPTRRAASRSYDLRVNHPLTSTAPRCSCSATATRRCSRCATERATSSRAARCRSCRRTATRPRAVWSRCRAPRRSSSASRASSCPPRCIDPQRGPISVYPALGCRAPCSASDRRPRASTTARRSRSTPWTRTG